MRIIEYIIAILRGVLILLSIVIYLSTYAFTRIFYKHTRVSGLSLRRIWLRQMCFPILNLKVEKKGSPIDEPALYVCNHRSFADPFYTSLFIDAFIIAKAEVANYPLISKGAEMTGVIYVKREDKSSRTSARQAFVDIIKSGSNILVYPEGTISTTKHTLPFKKGTFFSAAKEGIPVVPIALDYKSDRDIWRIHNVIFQYLNQFGKWKTEAKLTIGKPIRSDDGEYLLNTAHKWINEELDNMHEGWTNMNFDPET